MVISEKLQKIINEQINKEYYSFYLYLAMSAYAESINYKGFAKLLKKQSDDELTHAGKFYSYLFERGGKVVLEKIDAPKKEWKSVKEIFEDIYAHEQGITKSIYAIKEAALEEKDFATAQFLEWFIEEQVEEEDLALDMLNTIELVGDSKQGLFMIDVRYRG